MADNNTPETPTERLIQLEKQPLCSCEFGEPRSNPDCAYHFPTQPAETPTAGQDSGWEESVQIAEDIARSLLYGAKGANYVHEVIAPIFRVRDELKTEVERLRTFNKALDDDLKDTMIETAQLKQQVRLTSAELDRLRVENAELKAERDKAVAYASKIDRIDSRSKELMDRELASIIELPVGKKIDESISQAVARVLNENVELRKDKERLDFIDNLGRERGTYIESHCPGGLVPHWFWTVKAQGLGTISANECHIANVREAINAAMAKYQPDPQP